MFCDLHTHSVFSDGTFTPEEIIETAEKINLGAVALTDHDTVKGLPRFIKAAENKRVKAVCGAEFTTEYNNKELHIAGLFIPEKAFDDVENYVKKYLERKVLSNISLVEKLNEKGYDISYDEILRKNPDSFINRAHIAGELVKKSYFSSVSEAFSQILGEEHGFYTHPVRQGSIETVSFIKSIGALPVLAHPMVNLSADELYEFINEAKPAGLKAVETFSSHYDYEKQNTARKIVFEAGLYESGGSDFHGERKPNIKLGSGTGAMKVPMSVYEKLKSLI